MFHHCKLKECINLLISSTMELIDVMMQHILLGVILDLFHVLTLIIEASNQKSICQERGCIHKLTMQF